MHELYDLSEMLCKELKEYGKKEKLDMASLEAVDKLSESMWRICRIIDRYESMNEPEYSNGYSGNNSYANMSNRSYAGGGSYAGGNSYAGGRGLNARRDSMGRYSSRESGGYSNGGDYRMELQNMIQEAPNDYVRQKMIEAMNHM